MPLVSEPPLFRSTSPLHTAVSSLVRPHPEWPPAGDPVWSMVGCTRGEAEALENQLVGFILFPGLAGYEKARSARDPGWPTPRIIAYCHSERDVAACLAFVRERGWLVSIRSGGHNKAGYHLCNGLVIDVSALHDIEVSADAQQVAVGPGVMFDQLDGVLRQLPADQRFTVPGGTCGNVCCAGYYMGGGYSIASRTFGMGCDSVVAATVMLADGTIVLAAETDPDHADLLWALRGGSGGQFGVLLQLTLRGYRPDRFWGFLAQWDLESAPQVLEHLEEHHMASPRPQPEPFGYLVTLTNLVEKTGTCICVEAKPSLAILAMYHGSKDKGMRALADLFAIGTPRFRYDVDGEPYSVINNALFTFLPYDVLDLGNASSLSTSGLMGPDRSPDWHGLVECIAASPNPANLIAFEPYGGAIAAGGGATSFPHRAQKLDVLIDSFWNPAWKFNRTRGSAEKWLNETLDVVAPALSGRTYVNYAERGIRDYRRQYWAQNFGRLVEVKRRYDPEEVFRFDQSISWLPELDAS